MAGLGGVLYDIARSERFPKEERFPRLFFQLNPTVYLSVGKSRKRFSFNLASFPQMIPLDALRSTLNATNPLSLQAGNPGLKLQNDLSGSAGFQFTDVKKALSFSVRLNGSYTFNYITQRRTLFLEDTYLPQYDYTARKGAQLTTQANVGGNYNLGGRVSYSQQINPLRSTLNVSVNYGFSQTPYFTGEDLFHSVRHSLGFGFGFDSGFSSKVKLNIRSNTSMSSYTTQKETAQELREQLTARVDPALRQVFRVGRHALRILLQQPLARAHAPQRDPQRLGGAQVRQGEPAGAFGGRHRHPQPPRLHHHEFRHGLHRHLLNLLPGPLRLPARRLYVLIGSRRNYGVISVYFV